MRCLTEGRLRQYLDGELKERARKRADIHLAGCAVCRGRLAEMRSHEKTVNRFFSRLEPEIAPRMGLPSPELTARKRRPPVRRLLQTRVGLPIPVLAGMLALLLAMAGVVVFQQRTITRLSAKPDPSSRRLEIMIGSGNSIQGLTLDLDMSGYTPVKNPVIRVVKEKES
jgi:anti-sigma factor RsiW